MDIQQKLIATGLNEQQAKAYALLLESGSTTPPVAAELLQTTRSNAYKILDRLVEVSLAKKVESNKKFVYYPDNPMALSSLVAEQRNIASEREEAVKDVLKDLLTKFHTLSDQPNVQIVSGRTDVANAYRAQIQQLEPIFFIRSRADIPLMGFETMHDIRTLPTRHGIKRQGVTPDKNTGTNDYKKDQRSGLDRTWVRCEDYDSPVEWSVSGSSLLIVVFGSEPHAVTITNPVISAAFFQLWQLLNSCLRAMPYYSELPR